MWFTIVSAANIYESLGRSDFGRFVMKTNGLLPQLAGSEKIQGSGSFHPQVFFKFPDWIFTHSPDFPRIFTRLKSENIKGRNFPATFLRKELLKLIQQSKDKSIKARIGKGRASKTFPKSILQIPLTHLVR